MDVRAGELIEAGWGVLLRQWAWLAGGALVLALVQLAQKALLAWGAGQVAVMIGTPLLLVLVQWLIRAFVMRGVMEQERLVAPGTPVRYGQFVFTALVVTLGTFLGAALLVVPGIMALLRWVIADSYVLARGLTCRQALAASRDATRGHRWTILWAFLALALAAGVSYGALLASAGGLTALAVVPLWSVLGVLRLIWTVAATAMSMALAVGIYSVLSIRSEGLSEVFA
jgi:hypothetical protein